MVRRKVSHRDCGSGVGGDGNWGGSLSLVQAFVSLFLSLLAGLAAFRETGERALICWCICAGGVIGAVLLVDDDMEDQG